MNASRALEKDREKNFRRRVGPLAAPISASRRRNRLVSPSISPSRRIFFFARANLADRFGPRFVPTGQRVERDDAILRIRRLPRGSREEARLDDGGSFEFPCRGASSARRRAR